MFLNYLKIALRNLWNHKVFSSINILGIAAAVACSLLLILTALHQFSFDRFHTKGDKIYMLYQELYFASGTQLRGNAPAPLHPILKAEASDLEAAVRWRGSGASVEMNGQVYDESIRYTDPDFLDMFSFKLIEGNRENALENLNDILISESIAKKLFKNQKVIGETIKVSAEGSPKEFVVAGIIEDRPDNSTLNYGLITRFENCPGYHYEKDNWSDFNHTLFVQVKDNHSPTALAESYKDIVTKYFTEDIENVNREGASPGVGADVVQFKMMPFYNMYFGNGTINGQGPSKAFPIGLIILSFFILAIACINFVNLTLGGSLSRAKEVGVRKVLGANKRQLLAQFWGEALFVLTIALLVGAAIAQWILPEFNSTFRQSLTLLQPNLFIALGLILIFAGLAGGGYPAIVLSRFQAAQVLKGNTQIQKPGRLRNVLLVVQFTLSVLLISCTIIVYQQIDYLRSKPLGYNQEEVLSIPIGEELDVEQMIGRLRNELATYPTIKGVTASYANLGRGEDGGSVTSIMGFEHEDRIVQTHWNRVDYDFFETLEIEFLEGRPFSRDHPSDSASAIIINETFAKQLGEPPYTDLKLEINEGEYTDIIGVVEDYHFKSLSDEIAPLSLVLGGSDFRLSYIFVRMEAENVPTTMDFIQKVWTKINPTAIFQASFLNENTARLYMLEKLMGRLFLIAAALAIFLSCMGLFGVVLMVISQRTKEIGIRKVLGASVSNIVSLVSKDFVKMMLLSILIATPLAWWAMNKWLGTYAYGIKIQWWIFFFAGLIALAIAFITMSTQSIRAALLNPVESLRDE